MLNRLTPFIFRAGAVLRFARDCTAVNKESGCKQSSPEEVKQGLPAKSCVYICGSDGCNTGNGIHYGVGVLVSGLLTTVLSVFVRVWSQMHAITSFMEFRFVFRYQQATVIRTVVGVNFNSKQSAADLPGGGGGLWTEMLNQREK
jgi:hypothetical protein